MNWTIGEWIAIAIIAFCVLYPPIYIAAGGLQKDIRKLRKLWRDTDPNGNPHDTP